MRDEAAAIGTQVHEWIEKHIRDTIAGKSLSASWWHKGDEHAKHMQNCTDAFLKWETDTKPTYLECEGLIYNPELKYAGKFDYRAEIDGVREFGDFKTGGRLYPESGLQLAGYRKAAGYARPELRSAAGRLVLLNKETGEYDERYYTPAELDTHEEAFGHLVALYEWRKASRRKG